ncbi:MAG: hypothetical protein ABEJ55_07810 [Halanaeroarchaeum sp.]
MPATAGTEPNTTEGDGGGIGVLSALIPLASAIATASTDPVSWLRLKVLGWVLNAFVIKPIAWIYGFILQGFGIVADAISNLGPILSPIFGWIVNPFIGAFNGFYGAIRGILEGLGLGAPIAGAVAVAIILVVVLTIAVAIWRIIPGTELVGGITQWSS